MRTLLHFYEPTIDAFKKDLSLVIEYYDRTKNQFSNIEKEADDHADSFYENYPSTEYTDPADVAERAQDEGEIKYDTLSIMKSNHLLMSIVMLCNIWEQQLVKFTIQELKNFFEFKKRALNFSLFKNIFELHDIDINNLESWKKIKELRLLTNTIKHGEGTSAEALRKIRPDFFEHDFITGADTLMLHGAVLMNANSLKVEESDLGDYTKATINFWDEMPEKAFSDTDKIINAFLAKYFFIKL